MGPTIQENNALEAALSRKHSLELRVETRGSEQVINTLTDSNRLNTIEKTL